MIEDFGTVPFGISTLKKKNDFFPPFQIFSPETTRVSGSGN
jgi:hypothetical protein